MQSKKDEQFLKLCEQAANEQDSQKLLELAKEILRVLDDKHGLKRSATAGADNSRPQ